MADLAAYGGLLLSAFLSATLLPGSSEALLSGLLVTGRGVPWLLLAAAGCFWLAAAGCLLLLVACCCCWLLLVIST